MDTNVFDGLEQATVIYRAALKAAKDELDQVGGESPIFVSDAMVRLDDAERAVSDVLESFWRVFERA